MVHCGYEPTAAEASFNNPLKALWVGLRGVKTEGAMAKDIDLSHQRPAEFVFSKHVQEALDSIHAEKAAASEKVVAAE